MRLWLKNDLSENRDLYIGGLIVESQLYRGCMRKVIVRHAPLIKCAVLGGIIIFIWGLLSWMVLPWHARSFNKFCNECKVAEVIRKNAPCSGMYILPNTYGYDCCTPPCDIEESRNLMDCGPVMFASIQLCGVNRCSVMPFLTSLFTYIIGAAIVAWMLLLSRLSYWNAVIFVTLFGVAAALLGVMPAWIWWGFSGCYTLTIFFDLIIGWFLAGLLIARISYRTR